MDSFSIVIFGVTGNLAQIKLLPALYDLAEKELFPEGTSIIGVGRRDLSQEDFHNYFHKVLHLDSRHVGRVDKRVHETLLKKIHYLRGNFTDEELYANLKSLLVKLHGGNAKRCAIYYLATYPDLYKAIFTNLEKVGLNKEEYGFARVVIEKPMGRDQKSAQDLNALLLKFFTENQIYRLDHYLGKETLQNIINFRFGNGIFESLMTKDYIDHVQITSFEDFGITGRGEYYDKTGALNDVGQNHILQMIALATMEAPKNFSNEEITRRRTQLLASLVPMPDTLVLGQYEGYKDEDEVDRNSETETFFAFKTEIDNDRFLGVPIYIRAGKKLTQTATEISIVFKLPENRLLKEIEGGMDPNVLTYRIQPNEGISLKILVKTPGHERKIHPSHMHFNYKDVSKVLPDPYERLIVDILRGDQTFFIDAPEVDAQWKFIDGLRKGSNKLEVYKPGSQGPDSAEKLIQSDNRRWIVPGL